MADAMMMQGQKSNASGNVWWWVAAGGIALVLLAYVISFFNNFDTIQDEDKASAVFQMFGFVGFTGAVALMAVLQASWPMGIRVALLLGAGYFTMMGVSVSQAFSTMMGRFI